MYTYQYIFYVHQEGTAEEEQAKEPPASTNKENNNKIYHKENDREIKVLPCQSY